MAAVADLRPLVGREYLGLAADGPGEDDPLIGLHGRLFGGHQELQPAHHPLLGRQAKPLVRFSQLLFRCLQRLLVALGDKTFL